MKWVLSWVYRPLSGIAGSHSDSLIFWGIAGLFSKAAALLFSHQQRMRVPVPPHPHQHWWFSDLLIMAILVWVWSGLCFELHFLNDHWLQCVLIYIERASFLCFLISCLFSKCSSICKGLVALVPKRGYHGAHLKWRQSIWWCATSSSFRINFVIVILWVKVC